MRMERVSFSRFLHIIVVTVCVIQTLVPALSACPAECSCVSATQSVICTSSALSGFPTGIPVDTVNLLIRGTIAHKLSLQELKRDDLKDLPDLQGLTITHTLLSTVEKDAFADLKDLMNLDLSFNQIDTLEPGMFSSLSKLRFLHLTGNQRRYLLPGQFTGLTALKELYLGSMRLAFISPDVFTGLDSLQALDLSNNDLTELPPEFASGTVLSQLDVLDLTYNGLTGLSGALEPLFQTVGRILLADNPWHCDCGQAWLKAYPEHVFAQHGTQTLMCVTPDELRYEALVTVSDDRLVCIPPSIYCTQPSPVEEGDTLIVTCHVTGDPFPNVTWSAADGSVVEGLGDKGDVSVNRSEGVVQLSVLAALAWNGTLSVTCRNQRGSNHTDVHLLIYPITTTTTTTTTTTPTTTTTTPTTTTTTTTPTTTTATTTTTPVPTTRTTTSMSPTVTTKPVTSTPSARTSTSRTTKSPGNPAVTAASATARPPATSSPRSTSQIPSRTNTTPQPSASTIKPKSGPQNQNEEPEDAKTTDSSLQKATLFVALGIAILALLSVGVIGCVVYKALKTHSYRVNPDRDEVYRYFSQNATTSAPPTPHTLPRVITPVSITPSGDYLMPTWNEY